VLKVLASHHVLTSELSGHVIKDPTQPTHDDLQVEAFDYIHITKQHLLFVTKHAPYQCRGVAYRRCRCRGMPRWSTHSEVSTDPDPSSGPHPSKRGPELQGVVGCRCWISSREHCSCLERHPDCPVWSISNGFNLSQVQGRSLFTVHPQPHGPASGALTNVDSATHSASTSRRAVLTIYETVHYRSLLLFRVADASEQAPGSPVAIITWHGRLHCYKQIPPAIYRWLPSGRRDCTCRTVSTEGTERRACSAGRRTILAWALLFGDWVCSCDPVYTPRPAIKRIEGGMAKSHALFHIGFEQ
jgi:hypothetical protein